MKNKKHIYSIITLLIPVVVATIGELTEQLENKRRDEEMTSLRKRVDELERRNNGWRIWDFIIRILYKS